jgi:hypothetical protein
MPAAAVPMPAAAVPMPAANPGQRINGVQIPTVDHNDVSLYELIDEAVEHDRASVRRVLVAVFASGAEEDALRELCDACTPRRAFRTAAHADRQPNNHHEPNLFYDRLAASLMA